MEVDQTVTHQLAPWRWSQTITHELEQSGADQKIHGTPEREFCVLRKSSVGHRFFLLFKIDLFDLFLLHVDLLHHVGVRPCAVDEITEVLALGGALSARPRPRILKDLATLRPRRVVAHANRHALAHTRQVQRVRRHLVVVVVVVVVVGWLVVVVAAVVVVMVGGAVVSACMHAWAGGRRRGGNL
jgi:hypothetical protein